MSFIEKKYTKKIDEIFEGLIDIDKIILETLERKSIKLVDDIARLCANCNKRVNQILKTYYPEIKEMDIKLNIKSKLKFYYDLIDKLTDFVRNVENFQKIDDSYYELLIEFVEEKENLIQNKYRAICTDEMTAFYNPQARANLESIIAEKFKQKSRQFFTMGSLEEEIKKIGRVAGADEVIIFSTKTVGLQDFKIIKNPTTLIHYSIYSEDEEKLKTIGKELKNYLSSKGYEAAIIIVDFTELSTDQEVLTGSIVTNAKLLPDN